jgi:transposase
VGDWPVQLRCGEQMVSGRLCAVRKSRQAIEQAERKIARRKQQHKIGHGREARKYVRHTVVFTTLPASVPADAVLESYRRRWQIELTFKRLKSILKLGHLPKHNDQSSRAWLYGKLFVALLSQKLARIGRALSPWGYRLPGTPLHQQPLA